MTTSHGDEIFAAIGSANPILAAVARLAGTAGLRGPSGALRSAATLGAQDGAYYNRSLNTVVVYKAGVTLDGIDFSGTTVRVTADDVTLTRSKFDAKVGIAAVIGTIGTAGLTVSNSTFDGLKLDRAYNDFIVAQGRNTTITGNRFLDAPSDAIYIESGTVSNNYISGGGYQTDAHADAIWVGRTTGAVTIRDNLIDWRSRPDARVETNNAIRITAELGSSSNVTVSDNVLLGGAYTVAVSEIRGDRGSVSGVSVTGNVIDAGLYGPLYMADQPADLVYTRNLNANGPGQSLAGATGPSLESLLAGTRGITGTAAADALPGTGGRDFIRGGGGQDWISAGAGDDVIEGGAGRDYLSGGAGRDVFLYRSFDVGRDLISDFDHGSDRIDLASLPGAPAQAGGWTWLGSERFTGDPWQLRSTATANGNTLLQLDANGDQLADLEIEFSGRHSFSAADFILGRTGAEGVEGAVPLPVTTPTPPSASAPEIVQPAPPVSLPVLAGTPGNDILTGTAAAERILGGAGNDSIRAGAGDDLIVGGAGKDVIATGEGRDRILYESAADSLPGSRDYIADFLTGTDLIDLSGLGGLRWIGEAGFSGAAGELRFGATAVGSTLVQADLNGDRTADFAVELAGRQALTAGSFSL